MGEWPRVKVKDVCCLIVDCINRTAPVVDYETHYRMIRTTNVRNGRIDLSNCRYVDEVTFKKWTRRAVVNNGDVILTREAPIGEVGYVKDMGCVFLGQRTMQYRADPEKIDPRYLFFAFRSPELQYQFGSHDGSGSVVSHIRVADCHEFMVPLPPKKEQIAIGEFLGALDDKIDLNRRINETLEAMAQAIFKDWFIDFGPVRAKAEGCPPYLAPDIWALFPDALDDNDKPMGWKEKRIDDILELAYGKALKSNDRLDGSFPVYGSGGITGYHALALVEGPSIIVGRKGTVGSLYWEDGPFFPIDTVFYVKPKVPLTFCFYLLQTLGLDEMNTDAAVPGLNRNNVYRLPVSWSQESVREAFDGIAKLLRQKMRKNTEESQTLSQLRDLLLPRLMSGEICLRDAEKIIEKIA